MADQADWKSRGKSSSPCHDYASKHRNTDSLFRPLISELYGSGGQVAGSEWGRPGSKDATLNIAVSSRTFDSATATYHAAQTLVRCACIQTSSRLEYEALSAIEPSQSAAVEPFRQCVARLVSVVVTGSPISS